MPGEVVGFVHDEQVPPGGDSLGAARFVVRKPAERSQDELVEAFDLADQVVLAQVARLEQVPEKERLNPEQLMRDLVDFGKSAAYLPDVEAIIKHICQGVVGDDVVCIFSNGGFGGIHEKLLARLRR